MEKKFQKTLFIFRRDLRLEDNTGLIFALKHSEKVIPAFIFTEEQIEHNPYRSDHCLRFMIESLFDLEMQLKEKEGRLYFFKGKPEEVVLKAISKLSIDSLIVNRDYTPYSQKRDRKLESVAKANKISFFSFDDALLHPPETILKKDGTPYTVFTPYFRMASNTDVLPCAHNTANNYYQGAISFSEKPAILDQILPNETKNRFTGGRKEGLKILKKLSLFNKYASARDFPAEECVTHLSAYLKFTVCSPREVYAAICKHLSPHHELIRSLHWRDFFTMIGYFFPHVYKGAFRPKFDSINWSYDKNAFEKWCMGQTGFPIVDAGMREMNETGFMHNRVRMIAASFLVKDLFIDWRWGEQYFAKTLIDYDPAVNNGNWQWIASTGCDSQPYFRIFNPWLQQKKFDPDCLYIKKWISELSDLPAKIIHGWHTQQAKSTYPAPMIDHEKASKKALQAYKSITGASLH